MLAPWKKSYGKPRVSIKKQRHYLANKGPYRQSCGFSNSCVWVWQLDQKEGWVPQNWCLQTVVLEKSLKISLDSKAIQPVNPKGNQFWILIGRTEAEAPILWPPDAKRWLIGKTPMIYGIILLVTATIESARFQGKEDTLRVRDGLPGRCLQKLEITYGNA